jgi:hypothetical protein
VFGGTKLDCGVMFAQMNYEVQSDSGVDVDAKTISPVDLRHKSEVSFELSVSFFECDHRRLNYCAQQARGPDSLLHGC